MTHPINTRPLNLPYQNNLSTHPLNTLSTHPLNTLSTITPPSGIRGCTTAELAAAVMSGHGHCISTSNSCGNSNSSNSNNNSAYSVTTIGINTISQLLTKEINKSIGNLLNKVTGDKSLRFDIGSSVYNSGNLLDPTGAGIAINANKVDRTRVNLKLGRSFLNDKIVVNVGGDLDFNVRNTSTIQNSDLQWLPDVNVEFILSKDKKLRAILFNRNSLDINGSALGKRNRQGVSISYRKDFD